MHYILKQPQTLKNVTGHAVLMFSLNVELMSVYLDLSFVWCQQCRIFFEKSECYMINVLKTVRGLIPHVALTLADRTGPAEHGGGGTRGGGASVPIF